MGKIIRRLNIPMIQKNKVGGKINEGPFIEVSKIGALDWTREYRFYIFTAYGFAVGILYCNNTCGSCYGDIFSIDFSVEITGFITKMFELFWVLQYFKAKLFLRKRYICLPIKKWHENNAAIM